MKDTPMTIAMWHKDTLKNATEQGQVEKFIDEELEFQDAETREDKLLELADMFIVACGVARFSLQDHIDMMNRFCIHAEEIKASLTEIDKAVQDKMAVNRGRKWDEHDGNYQHIEE